MRARRVVTTLLAIALTLPAAAVAQQPNGDVWRVFAGKLDAGSEVVVRLRNGQHFRATLIDARPDALLVQPRARRPVPVQPVSYDAIQSLEKNEQHGMSGGKAAAIGVAAGVGAFLAILAILAASLD